MLRQAQGDKVGIRLWRMLRCPQLEARFSVRIAGTQGDNSLKKTKVQSKNPVALLVERKNGILAVLSTPLLELPIQKMLKKAKI